MSKVGKKLKVAVLGAGPITIGQACEFDYSGTQACQALREEGCEVLLINSNPATIMTDPSAADSTYVEPMDGGTVAKILRKERPDALLATMGGQTALNCLRDLDRNNVLTELDIRCLGVTPRAVENSESRAKFKIALQDLNIDFALSQTARTEGEAKSALLEIMRQTGRAFPIIIRPSFTLGGIGGGVAHSLGEFEGICESGIKASPTSEILIEESLLGWKEFELEVIKDSKDNFISVCSIENIDPMGVHTGDSTTVAPAQTLTDQEYQQMRRWAFSVVRRTGIEAGCVNVQFALCPQSGRMVVIEMNPRVSRSSALASKATGFPIARVSTKLAVGYSLEELRNRITQNHLAASFEPTLDYIVTKMPRFSFEKFPGTAPILTTQMQSVGEVMGIGRTFGEAWSKAVRSLDGSERLEEGSDWEDLVVLISYPNPKRLFQIVRTFEFQAEISWAFRRTCVDRWFLGQFQRFATSLLRLAERDPRLIGRREWFVLKQLGLSDQELSAKWEVKEGLMTLVRRRHQVKPTYKRIDACAAEFGVLTAYLYSTYEEQCEADPTSEEKIVVLGSGPNRIGQGLEFDYCCVHSTQTINQEGLESIMINCNPETVSTDYDVPSKLYFEPLTLEDVEEVAIREGTARLVVQFGGQTPLRLASQLEKRGQLLLGTDTKTIEGTESREQFRRLLAGTAIKQPDNCVVFDPNRAVSAAIAIGLPVIIRPSFVLGGSFMRIVRNIRDLEIHARAVGDFFSEGVLVERFLVEAVEFDIDCLSDGKAVLVGGIMEHVEQAGIHSGDSACSMPSHTMSPNALSNLGEQVKELAKTLSAGGLLNVQFAIQEVGSKNEEVYVLEVNPRASRTVPYVSKATRLPLVRWATQVMLGSGGWIDQGRQAPPLFSVKEAVFPFTKFPQSDCFLGPEMRSTGEVMGIGRTFGEAWSKAQKAAGSGVSDLEGVVLSAAEEEKAELGPIGRGMSSLGLTVLCTNSLTSVTKSRGLQTSSNLTLRFGWALVSISLTNSKLRKESQRVGTAVCSTIRGAQSLVLSSPKLGDLGIVRLPTD